MQNKFIKAIRKGFMWYMHHGLRVIWANVFGFFVHVRYMLLIRKDKQAYVRYKGNVERWNSVIDDNELAEYIKNVYQYKWDGPKGLFDHNNFPIEFFTDFGDCDDVGHYICQKLKSMYGKDLEYCKTRGYAELSAKPAFWHYDCVYKFKGQDEYILFNYGRRNRGKSIEELDRTMEKIYASSYKINELVSWPCEWM